MASIKSCKRWGAAGLIFIMVLLIAQAALALNIRKHHKNRPAGVSIPWAVQLAVEDNITNPDNYGIRLSFKKHHSRNAATRFCFGLLGREDNNWQRNIYYSDGDYWSYDRNRQFDVTGGYLTFSLFIIPIPDPDLIFSGVWAPG